MLSINRKNGKRHHWKCCVQDCMVDAIIENDILVRSHGNHSHTPNQQELECKIQAAKADTRAQLLPKTLNAK